MRVVRGGTVRRAAIGCWGEGVVGGRARWPTLAARLNPSDSACSWQTLMILSSARLAPLGTPCWLAAADKAARSLVAQWLAINKQN